MRAIVILLCPYSRLTYIKQILATLGKNHDEVEMGACIGYLDSFITDKNNLVAKVNGTVDGVSKGLKVVETTADLGAELLRMNGGSEKVVKGLHSMTGEIKDARTVMGVFKIFSNIIPNVLKSGEKSVELAGTLLYTEKDKRLAKSLELGVQVGKFIGNTSNLGRCGIAAPVCFAEKHFGDLGQTAHNIGKTLPIFGIISDFSGAVRHSFEVAQYNIGQIDGDAVQAAVVGLIQKILALLLDIFKLFRIAAPALVKLVIALLSAFLAIGRTYLTTT